LSNCTSCGKCLPACPQNAIYTVKSAYLGDPVIDQSTCTSCGECYKACPDKAVTRVLSIAEIDQQKCLKTRIRYDLD
jgi:ferredoxin